MSGFRLALVVSHPIQHFCPQYVSFAENRSAVFKVFFASMLGFKKYLDPNFKREISWGNLNLDKFQHEFLNGDQVLKPDKNLDAPSLDNALDEFNPDIIIIYGYFQRLQRRAHRWAIKHHVPIAYISDSELRQKRSWLKELLKEPLLRWYFSRISYFLTVGDANEAFYRRYGVSDHKLLRMHFPIDVNLYRESFLNRETLRTTIRKEYNIGEKSMVLSVVGKLVKWKNQDHVIEALLLLEKRGVFVHLFLIGSGEMQQLWEAKAVKLEKSKVHFVGFISIEELPAYYAATDIYVHPSSVEPHSIAISEAIYMGCPVIVSSNCGSYGQEDDVQEGKNGWVYTFGDIESLANSIERLVKQDDHRKAFSIYSHESGVKFQQRSHYQVLEQIKVKL